MPASQTDILIVRLGAMGDIIHALPAAASLKLSFPAKRIAWLVARKWLPLFEGNPYIDSLIPYGRKSIAEVAATWKRVKALCPATAIDFQGLIQSAMAGRLAHPREFIGLDKKWAREGAAAMFYSKRVEAPGPHRVERGLQLAAAAGATKFTSEAWLPPGCSEGALPAKPFVLANPFAGWAGKQWPLESYAALGAKLNARGWSLAVNVPPAKATELRARNLHVHCSSISGLIHATRQADAVVGVDSGPLHLAAALDKRGVAIYGPTDPKQTGPFHSRMVTLRATSTTTYKRHGEIQDSMRQISPDQVFEALGNL